VQHGRRLQERLDAFGLQDVPCSGFQGGDRRGIEVETVEHVIGPLGEWRKSGAWDAAWGVASESARRSGCSCSSGLSPSRARAQDFSFPGFLNPDLVQWLHLYVQVVAPLEFSKGAGSASLASSKGAVVHLF